MPHGSLAGSVAATYQQADGHVRFTSLPPNPAIYCFRQALERLAAQLRAAERGRDLARSVPNWAKAAEALSSAAAEQARTRGHVQQLSEASAGPEGASPQQGSEPEQALSAALDAAVTSVLLWAQAGLPHKAAAGVQEAQPGASSAL